MNIQCGGKLNACQAKPQHSMLISRLQALSLLHHPPSTFARLAGQQHLHASAVTKYGYPASQTPAEATIMATLTAHNRCHNSALLGERLHHEEITAAELDAE
ncbi:unnamed protein product [Cercospora beticola]|nr:unnamed protein product [Cercospora beticola]